MCSSGTILRLVASHGERTSEQEHRGKLSVNRTRHEIKAKNSKKRPVKVSVTRAGKVRVTGGTYSYDASIWEDILRKFSRAHGITQGDVIKIIAFCFPLWGGRKRVRNKDTKEYEFQYWVMSEAILDSRMGWQKFKRELDRAIRTTKYKLCDIDVLWKKRSRYKEMPFIEYEDAMNFVESVNTDNLFYGISNED